MHLIVLCSDYPNRPEYVRNFSLSVPVHSFKFMGQSPKSIVVKLDKGGASEEVTVRNLRKCFSEVDDKYVVKYINENVRNKVDELLERHST